MIMNLFDVRVALLCFHLQFCSSVIGNSGCRKHFLKGLNKCNKYKLVILGFRNFYVLLSCNKSL